MGNGDSIKKNYIDLLMAHYVNAYKPSEISREKMEEAYEEARDETAIRLGNALFGSRNMLNTEVEKHRDLLGEYKWSETVIFDLQGKLRHSHEAQATIQQWYVQPKAVDKFELEQDGDTSTRSTAL